MAESTIPAEQQGKKKMDTNTKIKWAITLIVPLILILIPYSGFYTYPVKMFFVITVFGLFVIAFEFFHLAVMAALLPALWAIFKVAPMDGDDYVSLSGSVFIGSDTRGIRTFKAYIVLDYV